MCMGECVVCACGVRECVVACVRRACLGVWRVHYPC
jgi:hypothetical protein